MKDDINYERDPATMEKGEEVLCMLVAMNLS